MKFKNKKTKPCKECPFARNNTLTGSKPGGADPTVYIGQSMGPFWLPCHMEKEYEGKKTSPDKVNQCAGAAIYRANVNAPKMPDEMLALHEDKETVFGSHAEFYAHYEGVSIKEAKRILTDQTIYKLFIKEMTDAQVKRLS
jgi:hypothetical protein